MGRLRRKPRRDRQATCRSLPPKPGARDYPIAAVMQPPTTYAGQISADGQFQWDGAQWVPLARGTRLPTSWTRPMELAAAGLLAFEAVFTVVTTAAFINHDAIIKILAQQGTQVPQGMTQDQFIGVMIGFFIGGAIVLAVFELLGAAGAYLGWRWGFWYVLVLLAFGALDALFNLGNLLRPDMSEFPLATSVIQELLCIAAAGVFTWMLIGVFMYGPWAMKRPGTN